MTTRIGGNRPPTKDGEAQKAGEQSGVLRTEEDKKEFRAAAAKENVPKAITDRFERAAPQIDKVLAQGGQAIAGKIQFSNAELAQLAAIFASILKQAPRADRKERARLFARAILKKKKLGKLLDAAPEAEVEAMFENIAEQLDSSPVFAQLVDDVTEGAKKINLG
jgi:hypothetical protein